MDQQEYVIKGTLKGMINVLQKDFDMPFDEAKFFVYNMINQYSKDEADAVNKQELDTWYLAKEDQYKGQILDTHMVINFTNVTQSLYHAAYDFLVRYLFRRKIDLPLIGSSLVYTIGTAVKKIADTDYCVFSCIVELCVGNKERFFDESDIVTAGKDGKCDCQEEDWKCTYLSRDDYCTCNEKKVKLSFNHLESQGIIKKVGCRWQLVK